MNDQSFHEIQLSGKQLVFLFMSAVVLAVVIFLLGVSVGRGVRGSVASASTADVGAPTDTIASAAPAGTKVTPADLDYREKLQGPGGANSGAAGAAAGAAAAATTSTAKPAETPATTPPAATPDAASTKPPQKPNLIAMAEDPSKAKAPTPTSTPKPTATKPATPPPAAKPAPTAAAPAAKSSDAGWFLQFGAFSTKGAADAVVRDLKGKGYTASSVNSGALFKVRMGPYADRAEADKMVSRLTKDGYKPLVTR
jgi:cell division protein FtsN